MSCSTQKKKTLEWFFLLTIKLHQNLQFEHQFRNKQTVINLNHALRTRIIGQLRLGSKYQQIKCTENYQ